MATYQKKTGFYRKHDRLTEDNLVIDEKTGELIELPSMTKQEFTAQCDINNILKQFKITGMVQHMSSKAQTGQFLDLPDEMDLQEALAIVQQSENAFASLPSKIRSRFDNDPIKFLEFMHDPQNQDEIYDLGLATRPTPPDSNSGAQPVQETPAKE